MNHLGDVYEGEFHFGKKSGLGNLTTQIHDCHPKEYFSFIGEFLNGKKNGRGQLKRSSEVPCDKIFIYNGDFKQGLKHGSGEAYWQPWVLQSDDEPLDNCLKFDSSQFVYHYSG